MRSLALLAVLTLCLGARAQEPAECVDPFIGTTNFGTANPGAVTPHGMMSVVPFNVMGSEENVYDKDARWWSTPYEYHNKFFTGFAHGALSGVGCPELGALLTMATTGPLTVDYREYGTSYRDEKASPGYYSVFLDKYGVLAEVTATARTSVERYTFPGGEGHILLNLGEGLTNESGAMVRRVSATEIEGTKLLGTFCYNAQKVFPVYFVLRVSKTPSAGGYWKKQRKMTGVEAEWTPDNGRYKLYTEYGRELSGDDVGYWFSFDGLAAGRWRCAWAFRMSLRRTRAKTSMPSRPRTHRSTPSGNRPARAGTRLWAESGSRAGPRSSRGCSTRRCTMRCCTRTS